MTFGSEWGVGIGLTGQSYGTPTMQGGVNAIRPSTDQFIAFAKSRTGLRFLMTRIVSGIAGFKDEGIAPLFKEALDVDNIYLSEEFYDILMKLTPNIQGHQPLLTNYILLCKS